MPNNKIKLGLMNGLNKIWDNATKSYQEVVPRLTQNSLITDLSNVMLDENYQSVRNEFISGLVQRIALTKIENMERYQNPLETFKKGSLPLGLDVQSIFTNPIEAQSYELSDSAMQKLLRVENPDVKAAYYRRNRQDLYPVTIANETLTAAFVSWQALEDLIASITNSLYSGNYIDEFKYTKGLIDAAFKENKILIEEVNYTEDAETGKQLIKTLRTLFSRFKFPSSNYNSYSKMGGKGKPVITWTTPDRICLIIRSDLMASLDVDVLAAAFNIDSSKLLGRIYEVDEFENPGLYAIICDESFLQIYDNLFKFTEFYNARTLSWQYYLHAWGTYSISPFANAVAICETGGAPTTETTSIVVPQNLTYTKGQALSTQITVLPSNASSPLTAGEVENVTTTISKAPSANVYNVNILINDASAGGEITIPFTSGSITQNLIINEAG